MDKKLKENLAKARARMKLYTDKNSSEREFREGDWVYLKLKHYRQVSVARRTLPENSKIHPVFHVSLLKKKIRAQEVPIQDLPEEGKKGILFLASILDKRICKKGNVAGVLWIIQWQGKGIEDSM
ncbi:hypothetical protein ACH5RR_016038 [Cinchona calisaya]|uniref:Reverse transcriptase n=1 Tax=Cinchona calisaya TaxID=153742 RepID=A0ABD2ZVR4_9GENT